MTYTYDGDGKRVEKCTTGSTAGTCSATPTGTLYWTGPGWDPLLETDLSGNATEEYVFFNGERVARVDLPANSVEYYFSDHLKSTDIVTNATGGIVRESDYVPYGGEVVISGTDPNRYKFTGRVGHFSDPRLIINGGAPLLTLFEKWPAATEADGAFCHRCTLSYQGLRH